MIRPFFNKSSHIMKKIFCILLKYLLVILIWFFIFYCIKQTKNNLLFSIDFIITSITLVSLALQNLKHDKIIYLQDKVAEKLSIYSFCRISSFIFLILFMIIPVVSFELKDYFLEEEKLYLNLSKQLIILAFIYFLVFYIFSFFGKDIDNYTESKVNRKYALIYGILLLLYTSIKFIATTT